MLIQKSSVLLDKQEKLGLNLTVISYCWIEGWLCNKDTIFGGWGRGGGEGGRGEGWVLLKHCNFDHFSKSCILHDLQRLVKQILRYSSVVKYQKHTSRSHLQFYLSLLTSVHGLFSLVLLGQGWESSIRQMAIAAVKLEILSVSPNSEVSSVSFR